MFYEARAEGANAEQQWDRIAGTLVEAAENIVPSNERTMRQEWMNEQILEKIKRRRLNKKNSAECKRLDKQIKQDCTAGNEDWLNGKCDEIESLSDMDSRVMYDKIKN